MPASYDGNSLILGRSVSVVMIPARAAMQMNQFFGVSGEQSLYGGTRGRVFRVSGVLWGLTRSIVDGYRDLLLSYNDGIGRTLVDTNGTAYTNVVFEGVWAPVGNYGSGHGGVCLPYQCEFRGRI